MLALLSTLATLGLAAAAVCPATFRINPNGNTQYCLTVADPSAANSVATVQTCNGSPGQDWTWQTDSYSDIHHLRPAGNSNNLCLAAEVYRVSGAYNGRQLALTGCYNDGAQGWTPASGNQLIMQGQLDNRQVCMDLRDGSLNGGAVQIWYCYPGNTNQMWTFSS